MFNLYCRIFSELVYPEPMTQNQNGIKTSNIYNYLKYIFCRNFGISSWVCNSRMSVTLKGPGQGVSPRYAGPGRLASLSCNISGQISAHSVNRANR